MFLTPVVVPVTSTLTEHDAPAASVAIFTPMERSPPPGLGWNTPQPTGVKVPVGGVATINPVGRTSFMATLVRGGVPAWFVFEKVNVAVANPFISGILGLLKDLVREGPRSTEILALPVVDGSLSYLSWLDQELAGE